MRKNFDVEKESDYIVTWIRNYFEFNYGKTAVIGISGGKDSTIIAKLCCMALGKENVYGVLMPNGDQKDIEDSYAVVDYLKISYTKCNIQDSYKAVLESINLTSRSEKINEVTKINIAPRLRMTTLYAIASTFEGGRVVCTGNACEEFVGYTTKWGDNCGDFAPLLNYTVSEVIAIGDYIGLPKELVHKKPADGLTNLTDEDNLGFSYDEVEEFMELGIDSNEKHRVAIHKKHITNSHKISSIKLPAPFPLINSGYL